MSDQLLTFLKLIFLALLYLFFLRVLRAVWVELREPKPAPVPRRRGGRAPTRVRRRLRSRRRAGAPSGWWCVEPADRRGRGVPARRRGDGRAGRRLRGVDPRRHLRLPAARPGVPPRRGSLCRGPRVHQRDLPQQAQGHRRGPPCARATSSRSARRPWKSAGDRAAGRGGDRRRPGAFQQPGRAARRRPAVRGRRRHGRTGRRRSGRGDGDQEPP